MSIQGFLISKCLYFAGALNLKQRLTSLYNSNADQVNG